MSRYAIIADYGGVLADHHQEPAESELARILEVDIVRCRMLLSEHSEQGRKFREDALTEAEFWIEVASLAGLPCGKVPSYSVLSRLWAETYKLNSQVLEMLLQYRSIAAIGVLTNIDRARSRYLTEVIEIDKLVDIYLPSFRFRATKYSPVFWREADDMLRASCPGATIIYIDDRLQHVRSCEDIVGWTGLVYKGLPRLRAALDRLAMYGLRPL